MRYDALFGWSFLIYASMFCLWWIFRIYGFTEGDMPTLAGLFALVALSLVAGLSLRAHSSFDVLPYSLSWALLMAAFDAALSVPILGILPMLDPRVWVGYALVAVVPLASPALRHVFTRYVAHE